MSNRYFAIAGLAMGFVASTAGAQTHLFMPATTQAAATATTSQAGHAQYMRPGVQRVVALDTAGMRAMKIGDQAIVTSPAGIDYVVTYDRTETGYGGGKVWVGHLRDFGRDNPVFISTFRGAVSGNVETPAGKLRLSGSEDAVVVTDVAANGEQKLKPTQSDIIFAPPAVAPNAGATNAIAPDNEVTAAPSDATTAAAGVSVNTQLDLLFLFSPSLQTKLGSFDLVIARANHLVAVANTVYQNSGLPITLNIVYAQALNVSYADTTDADGPGGNPPGALTQLTSDATVAYIRSHYGADLVTFVRPFQANICGLAWIPNDFTSGSSQYGYSVVEDGSNGSFFCEESSMTHEIGHNMGANHDIGTTQANGGGNLGGTPVYNRGYCTDVGGGASSIMAYDTTTGCADLKYNFSSPSLLCDGAACGVAIGTSYTATYNTNQTVSASGADSVTALNTNVPQIAAWRNGTYMPVAPARLLDTRTTGGPIPAGTKRDLAVGGTGGLPLVGLSAYSLNVTAVTPSSVGYLTVWPAGAAQPVAANLNLNPGLTIPNSVLVKNGSDSLSSISIYNGGTAATNVVVDLGGWFTSPSVYNSMAPVRVLDTRSTSPIAPGGTLALSVTNANGVPASGVGAVVLNVTPVAPSGVGFMTVWPTDVSPRPTAANLNLNPGKTIPNLVISKVSAAGQVSIYNGGTTATNVVADLQGWFPTTAYHPLTPARLLDTRTSGGPIAAGGTLNLAIPTSGTNAVPASGTVALNVTAVNPQGPGFLTVWPMGATRPGTANLNLNPGLTIPNLVISQISSGSQVSIYNGGTGPTDVVVDLQGWFPPAP